MSINMDLSVEKELLIDAPVEKVWDAITDPEQVRKYFFGTTVETDWKAGSPIFFSGEWEGKSYRDIGRILNIETNSHIQYSYYSALSGLPDTAYNYSIVTYSLEDREGKTLLQLDQRGFADEKAAEHGQSGWDQVLKGLKELVE